MFGRILNPCFIESWILLFELNLSRSSSGSWSDTKVVFGGFFLLAPAFLAVLFHRNRESLFRLNPSVFLFSSQS